MVDFMENGAVELTGEEIMTHDLGLMSDLIEATRANGTKMDAICGKIDTLSNQHKDIIRWLLLVVCFIALGSKAMEMASSLWGRQISSTIESKP